MPLEKVPQTIQPQKKTAYRGNSLETGTHLSLVGSRSSDKIRIILKQQPVSSGCVSFRALKKLFYNCNAYIPGPIPTQGYGQMMMVMMMNAYIQC